MNETQASLRENLRALPRGAWILFFGTFLNKFGTFVLPFLAIYMTRLGYTSAQAGLAIGAYGIGTLGACLLGGYTEVNCYGSRTHRPDVQAKLPGRGQGQESITEEFMESSETVRGFRENALGLDDEFPHRGEARTFSWRSTARTSRSANSRPRRS